jgi:DNA-directed RNA polymerase specialized sigma24 family protein
VTEPDRERLLRLAATLQQGSAQDAWQALEEVLRLLAPAAEARLRSMHLDRESIDDVLSETVLAVFEHRNGVDVQRSLAGYFLTTAHRLAIRRLARRVREEPLDESRATAPAFFGAGPGDAGDPSPVAEALAQLDDEDAAIAGVAWPCAAAADDRAWTAAIAAELGLEPNAVRVRKHRALAKLERILRAVDPPPMP